MILVALILRFALARPVIAGVINLVLLICLFVVLYKDAESRNISKAHCLWALLGILGVLIYHLAFAKSSTTPQPAKQ